MPLSSVPLLTDAVCPALLHRRLGLTSLRSRDDGEGAPDGRIDIRGNLEAVQQA